MLNIDEIARKNKTEVTFNQWSLPAFTALVWALHSPEHCHEFNKYWYDAILIGDAQALIRAQEQKLQRAEQSLQYIIEISNPERSGQLANSFRELEELYRSNTRSNKEYIAKVAKRITGLDSSISRVLENYETVSQNMRNI